MAQVIVVGGGLSGMSAAHTVLQRGGRVLLLDKSAFCGGNSTKATSGINGAGTSVQRTYAENKDAAEVFERDTTLSAGGTVRPALIRALTHQSASAVEWLQDSFGLKLNLLGRLGGHSQHRTHRGGERFPGMEITYTLIQHLEKVEEESEGEQARILNKATVSKLLKDPQSNNVIGCEYEFEGQTHTAYGPVILTTGGFGADFSDSSLLAEVEKKWRTLTAWDDVPTIPPLRSLPTTNGKHCTGDGIKLARDVGAGLYDMHMVQVHPTGLVDPKDPEAKVRFLAAGALRGAGGLLLDNEGRRFVDELGHRDHVTGRMWKHGKGPYRLVLNGASAKKIMWHCEHYEGRGLMKKFNSGAELAKEIGCPVENLAKTFSEYNAFAATGKKDIFGKEPYNFFSTPWKNDDVFYVGVVGPVVHYTMGGVAADEYSRVVGDDHKTIIPGLYVGGEVQGGIHGENRLGGSSLLDCVVFGRLAGASATKHLTSQLSRGGQAQAQVSGGTARLQNLANQIAIKVRPTPNGVSLDLEFGDSNTNNASMPAVTTPVTKKKGSALPDLSKDLYGASGQVGGSKSAAPAAGTQSGGTASYTAEEVAAHNKADDCWVVLDGKIYDVTDFLNDHPGGKGAIMLYAGKDATKEFLMLHKPSIITRYGAKMLVGDLK